ncbi:MAG: GIY-YIG nuclease family protein [Marinobacter sp.]|uniref:GIY-YIG nuclease family protein n=1 Tax=Marinobacter sp. AC-23 TaxID=1879031 RepID=UPI0008DCCA34|nr:GIY-YIG nuclease family protein [Marinobacter sp. AC-23]OHY81467.1 hypothetical protein BCA33_11260 [Marinobacter sp. AC-23]
MDHFIYIASSSSMPGVVKIGKTNQPPSETLNALDASGAQKTFYREFSAIVDDAGMSVGKIHVKLSRSGFKIGPGLFRIFLEEAIEILFSVIDDLRVHSYPSDTIIAKLVEDLEQRRLPGMPLNSTSWKNNTLNHNVRDKTPSAKRPTKDSFLSSSEVLAPKNIQPGASEIGSGEFIYVLSNPSMPGYVKVGRTNTSFDQRLSELQSTGVPTRFELELGLEVESSVESERKVHKALSKFRPEQNREFFKIPVKKAIETVLTTLDDYRIHKFRENYGIETLVYESALKSREIREKRHKKITQLRSELALVNHEVTKLDASLRHQEIQYKSLGPYPENRFGIVYVLAIILFPVAIIFSSSSGGDSEKIMAFLVVGLVCLIAVNGHLEKECDKKATPFNDCQKSIDAIKHDLYPLQERARKLKESLSGLGENT